MSSPQFEAIRQFLRANPTPDDVDFPQQRETNDALAAQTPLPADVYTETVQMGGVAGLLIASPGVDDRRLVLYLHGGGYCTGSSLTHRDFGWRFSAAAGARVLLLDYRLAPEHPFPAAVEDTLTAYRWLLAQGFDPGQIAIGGDSAGGGLAVAALVALRDEGTVLPATAVLISPWTDLTGSGDSIRSKADADPLLTANRLADFSHAYLGEADPKNPLASPLFSDLRGLPPLLIQVGEAEILLDDAVRLAEKAQAAGVDVTLDVWEEMFHVWHGFAAVVPESQEAIAQAGEFIQKHFGERP